MSDRRRGNGKERGGGRTNGNAVVVVVDIVVLVLTLVPHRHNNLVRGHKAGSSKLWTRKRRNWPNSAKNATQENITQ